MGVGSRCSHFAFPFPRWYLTRIDIPTRQGLSLELCSSLRELFLGVTRSPGPMLGSFLNSITSPKLTEITFEFVWEEYSGDDISTIADFKAWEDIDEILCALADKLPNRSSLNPLSVILSVRTKGDTKFGKTKMGHFLKKFQEKGRITVAPFKGFLQPVCRSRPPQKCT